MEKVTVKAKPQPDTKKKLRTLDDKELKMVTGGYGDQVPVEDGTVIHFPPP